MHNARSWHIVQVYTHTHTHTHTHRVDVKMRKLTWGNAKVPYRLFYVSQYYEFLAGDAHLHPWWYVSLHVWHTALCLMMLLVALTPGWAMLCVARNTSPRNFLGIVAALALAHIDWWPGYFVVPLDVSKHTSPNITGGGENFRNLYKRIRIHYTILFHLSPDFLYLAKNLNVMTPFVTHLNLWPQTVPLFTVLYC